MRLTAEQASAFATLALRCIQQEYPNAPGHVYNGLEDLKLPRELHPAFYGSFDWHSAVHGHWMLVRLLRHADLPEADEIREVLNRHLSQQNLQIEAAYFEQANRKSFERTYGWAWVLKLGLELKGTSDPDIDRWSLNFNPLEKLIRDRYLDFLPRQTYPIRTGTHPNSAFGLTFAYDYAIEAGEQELAQRVEACARKWFEGDAGNPVNLEPGGADFFSPALMEADLMRRVLVRDEFKQWFQRFLPLLETASSVLNPAIVSDRTDPQIAHLDGLNLSRAWCFRHLAEAIRDDARHPILLAAAERHEIAGLEGVFSGDFAGEHWLATFATYLLTETI